MKIVGAVLGCTIVAVLGTIAFIYSGLYDVAAISPENRIVAWALHQTFSSSVTRQMSGVQVPPNFDAVEAVQSGARFYSENCVICHGAPGQQITAIAFGMNPAPPDILAARRRNDPAGVFWIVKNGVKMTGMPAFGKTQSDTQIWAIAAFLHKARGITTDEYQNLTGTRCLPVAPPSLGVRMSGSGVVQPPPTQTAKVSNCEGRRGP
jgi:mono/diheme cytochrome c family protein